MADLEIIGKGSRTAVPEGVDPMDHPFTVTFTIGERTVVTFTTTPAAMENDAEADKIEELGDHFGDYVVQVVERMAETMEAQVADHG